MQAFVPILSSIIELLQCYNEEKGATLLPEESGHHLEDLSMKGEILQQSRRMTLNLEQKLHTLFDRSDSNYSNVLELEEVMSSSLSSLFSGILSPFS